MTKRRTYEEIETELRAVQARLEEVEATLRAITNNEVDALVVDGSQGLQVFTLQNADQPYHILMETMAEGALTVAADGTILYCNRRFAEMLRAPLNRIIGLSLQEIMAFEDWQAFHTLLHASETEGCRGEYHLVTPGGNDDLPQNSLRARAPRNSLIINAEVISHNHFPPTRPEKRFSPLISRHRTRVTGLQ